MANIYLRLPTVICYFHRNYDVDNKLDNFEPVKFSKFTDHAVVLRGGLALHNNRTKKVVSCYSQIQWKNMLAGRKPDGSKIVLKRDNSLWLTYSEICQLEGIRLSYRSDSYDFLCIQIPNTILVGDREVRTNSSFSLTPLASELLQDLLVRDFERALIDWEIGTFDHCVSPEKIIRRGRMDTIERFLMRYDIPVSSDRIEKQSLRRQLDRWMEHARLLEKAYRSFDIEYEDSHDKVIMRKPRV